MKPRSNALNSLFSGMLLLAFLGGMGCESHHYYRAYDPYYTDYHEWNANENGYYHRWANETHRDPHRDFRKLPPSEQKEYWTWRHNHGDRDDRDHH